MSSTLSLSARKSQSPFLDSVGLATHFFLLLPRRPFPFCRKCFFCVPVFRLGPHSLPFRKKSLHEVLFSGLRGKICVTRSARLFGPFRLLHVSGDFSHGCPTLDFVFPEMGTVPDCFSGFFTGGRPSFFLPLENLGFSLGLQRFGAGCPLFSWFLIVVSPFPQKYVEPFFFARSFASFPEAVLVSPFSLFKD